MDIALCMCFYIVFCAVYREGSALHGHCIVYVFLYSIFAVYCEGSALHGHCIYFAVGILFTQFTMRASPCMDIALFCILYTIYAIHYEIYLCELP